MGLLEAGWEGLGDVARGAGDVGGELGKGVDEFMSPGVRAAGEGIKDVTGVDLSGKSEKSWLEQGAGLGGLLSGAGISGFASSLGMNPKTLVIGAIVIGGAVLLIMVMK